MTKPQIPEKCPKCGEAVTEFEYGFMASCRVHGVVVDNRPAETKARIRREQDDARWRAANSHLFPFNVST